MGEGQREPGAWDSGWEERAGPENGPGNRTKPGKCERMFTSRGLNSVQPGGSPGRRAGGSRPRRGRQAGCEGCSRQAEP